MRVPSRQLPIIALAVALAAACAACGSSQAPTATATSAPAAGPGAGTFPVSLTAANGKVHLPARPAAIISLSPTLTEMLYAIGAGSQVKAVDADSNYPPRAPRTKLSGLAPNVEAIVADKPDLVVESYDTGNLTKRLAAFSIPVLELPAPTQVAGVYSEFTQLGRATGHVAQASSENATIRKQIAAIVAAAPHPAKPVTYYYELDQTYYSLTSSTFVGHLLGLLGMKSIADAAKGAAAAGGYPQLSSEYILRSDPAFILLADTVCCHQNAAAVAKRPGWASMSAVKAGHVIALNDDIASRWGPRIVDLLRTVATALRRGGQ
ncbi:MAG TPA: ABC transporter substrate-binding protein [Actinobacteria bacterium]|nr:ABC transporter substrate-binding protein [Actinomycetota bacterium]